MLSRRKFLAHTGIGLLGVAILPWEEGCESNTIEPLTAGSEVPFITAQSSMYVQNGAAGLIQGWTQPQLDATWRLSVDGLFASPATFSLQELQTMGAPTMVTFLKTQQCVLDAPLVSDITGLTGNAYWTGFPLKVLLDHCGINRSSSKRVRIYGADGFSNNLTLARVYSTAPSDLLPPMLVTEMNGASLSPAHGFPIRIIVPEMFGFKSVKWITRIEATDLDVAFGTYQDAGFFDDGTLGVNSKVTRPINNVAVQAGVLQVIGFALSGPSLSLVEVSIDGGAWTPAEIVPIDEIVGNENIPATIIEQTSKSFAYPYRGVWAKWRYLWDASAGAHTVSIRATDALGRVQPVTDTEPSDGANAIAVINVTVS